MSMVIGYRGDPVFSSSVNDDPRATIPSSRINLADTEVAAALVGTPYTNWNQLGSSQKRQIARQILSNRGDVTSLLQLDQLSLNIARFADFNIVHIPTIQVPPSAGSHFGW